MDARHKCLIITKNPITTTCFGFLALLYISLIEIQNAKSSSEPYTSQHGGSIDPFTIDHLEHKFHARPLNAFPPRRIGFDPSAFHVGVEVEKWHRERFF
jgi:hypothetical protein